MSCLKKGLVWIGVIFLGYTGNLHSDAQDYNRDAHVPRQNNQLKDNTPHGSTNYSTSKNSYIDVPTETFYQQQGIPPKAEDNSSKSTK